MMNRCYGSPGPVIQRHDDPIMRTPVALRTLSISLATLALVGASPTTSHAQEAPQPPGPPAAGAPATPVTPAPGPTAAPPGSAAPSNARRMKLDECVAVALQHNAEVRLKTEQI